MRGQLKVADGQVAPRVGSRDKARNNVQWQGLAPYKWLAIWPLEDASEAPTRQVMGALPRRLIREELAQVFRVKRQCLEQVPPVCELHMDFGGERHSTNATWWEGGLQK